MVAGLGMHFADAGDLVLVGRTETAAALWPLLAAMPCDVLVVNAPELGGMELLQVLVRLYLRGVILCTEVLSYRAPLMAVGARGYLTTDNTLDDLLAVIRTVARRGWARSPLAESCWQWYRENGDTLAPVQAAAMLRREKRCDALSGSGYSSSISSWLAGRPWAVALARVFTGGDLRGVFSDDASRAAPARYVVAAAGHDGAAGWQSQSLARPAC